MAATEGMNLPETDIVVSNPAKGYRSRRSQLNEAECHSSWTVEFDPEKGWYLDPHFDD